MRARVCRRVAPLALLAGVVGLFSSQHAFAADKAEAKAPARVAKKTERIPKDSSRPEQKEARDQPKDQKEPKRGYGLDTHTAERIYSDYRSHKKHKKKRKSFLDELFD